MSDDAAGMRVPISKGIVGKAAAPPFPTHHPVFGGLRARKALPRKACPISTG